MQISSLFALTEGPSKAQQSFRDTVQMISSPKIQTMQMKSDRLIGGSACVYMCVHMCVLTCMCTSM